MSGRRVLAYAACAAVAAAAALWWTVASRQPVSSGLAEAFWPSALPWETVATVRLQDAGQLAEIEKNGTRWIVAQQHRWCADADRVGRLLAWMQDLSVGHRFVADHRALSRLDLAPQRGGAVQVQLSDNSGRLLADIVVGRQQTMADGTTAQWVRRAASSTAVLVGEPFYDLSADPAGWIQHDVVTLAPQAIEAVSCTGADGQVRFVLKRQGGRMVLTAPAALAGKHPRPAAVSLLLESVAPLKALGVCGRLADNRPPGWAEFHLTFELQTGGTLRVWAGRQEETALVTASFGGRFSGTGCRPDAEGRPWVFTVENWQFQSLVSNARRLLAGP